MSFQKSSHKLYAANRTEITVSGEVDFIFEIEGREVQVHAVVTPDISSLILGTEFMSDHNIQWLYNESKVKLDGKWFQLTSLPNREFVRLIYSSSDVYIPAQRQLIVPVKVPLPTLKPLAPSWSTNSRLIDSGVMSANVLINGTDIDVALPLLNITKSGVSLKSGTFLGYANIVEILDDNENIRALNHSGDDAIKINDEHVKQRACVCNDATNSNDTLIKCESLKCKNRFESNHLSDETMMKNVVMSIETKPDISHLSCNNSIIFQMNYLIVKNRKLPNWSSHMQIYFLRVIMTLAVHM